jgi:ABC-type branched-subunit amino acid transport system permease subunit
MLFANCVFVSPTMFSLAYSGQIIIWVMVGGVGTLFGPVVGAMLLQALTAWAGTLPDINPNLILGLVLVVAVLAIPRGLQPTLAGLLRKREAP